MSGIGVDLNVSIQLYFFQTSLHTSDATYFALLVLAGFVFW